MKQLLHLYCNRCCYKTYYAADSGPVLRKQQKSDAKENRSTVERFLARNIETPIITMEVLCLMSAEYLIGNL